MSAHRSGKRVLVVDNDAEWRALIRLDLRLEGHEVVGELERAAGVVERVAQGDVEVVVLDHRMPPGPHGAEVADRLHDEHPDVTVVVFTNYEAPELVRAVARAGATYVLKPNLTALRAAVAASRSGD